MPKLSFNSLSAARTAYQQEKESDPVDLAELERDYCIDSRDWKSFAKEV